MTRPQKDGFEFYFALDTHCKVRDYAIRNDTGEGFEQFIQRNVEGQRSGKNYPDYWLFQYTIPDDVLLRIRQQERLIGPDFLQNSLPILLEEGVAPQCIVRLRDAAFCWQMNIPYLSPETELERLRHHDGYQRAMFCFGEGMKRLPSFDTLTAVETRQGLLLFTDTPRGTECYEEMWDYYLLHFFHPQLQDTQLRMYRLPQFDTGWQKYVDLFRLDRDDKDRGRYAFGEIPPGIFAPKALLAYAIRTDTFDLAPTVQNYEKLIDNVPHTPHYSSYSFDIAVLQTMQQNGMSGGMKYGIMNGLFPSAEAFETLAREYGTSAESSATQRKLQERTRQLAAEILKKNYPLRRGMQPHRNKYDDISDLHVPSVPPNRIHGVKRR